MYQCSVYDHSLRFSRAIYGILVLVGYFTKNYWYVLAVIIMLALGAIDVRLNLPYRIHLFFTKHVLRKPFVPINKDSAELNFVSGMTGVFVLIGFLCIYFNKFVAFGWIWLMLMSLLLFLACFAGFCVATLSYAIFIKLTRKNA